MAHKNDSNTGYEQEIFPTSGSRLLQRKFSPGKKFHFDLHDNSLVFNGDEGIQVLEYACLQAHHSLDKVNIAAAEKRQVQLAEGLQKLDKAWEDLDIQENQFRAVVKKFNEFVKENLIKRERFIHTCKRSQEQIKRYSNDTAKLKEKKLLLLTTLEEMKKQVRKHSVYERFLERVVNFSGEFKTVHSFVSSFKTLTSTLDDTTAKFVKNKFLLLKLMNEVTGGAQEKADTLYKMRTGLSKLGPLLNDVKARNNENEMIIIDVHQEAIKAMRDVRSTLQFMNYLYKCLCYREKKSPKYPINDYENQMMAIKRILGNFEKVVSSCE